MRRLLPGHPDVQIGRIEACIQTVLAGSVDPLSDEYDVPLLGDADRSRPVESQRCGGTGYRRRDVQAGDMQRVDIDRETRAR